MVVTNLRERRERAALSQQALAERVGVTRQALGAIEAGRQTPSTAVALRLARVLGCLVEDLFRLESSPALRVRTVVDAAPSTARVALGRVRGDWIAHALPPRATSAADGVLGEGAAARVVEPLADVAALEHNVLVAGCAPLIGVIADRAGLRFGDVRVRWLSATSTRALDLLQGDLVHVAGTHLVDETSGEGNLPVVRARFEGRRMIVVNLVRWRQGLVLPAGNPRGIRDVADLAESDFVVAWREEGAGARKLLERHLAAAGVATAPGGVVVEGHMAVAQAVAMRAADVGVAIESAALAYGLDFVPLAEERFDFVLDASTAETRPLAMFLDALDAPAFRREVEAMGGYDASVTGHAVAVERTS